MIGCMAETAGLSEIELVWLIGWNAAAGQWERIGLGEPASKEFFLDLISKLQGNPLDAAKQSRIRLQQGLMSLRRERFEEIQREAPFSRYAQANMEALLRAWMEKGEAGFTQVWQQIFQPGWEAARERQDPIQIVEGLGDCEERALEVKGAVDQETRVAAEWWYLYYTFGREWTPGMHFTISGKEDGAHFSVHDIHIVPNTRRRVYFRLPW